MSIYLSYRQVDHRYGVSRSTIWRRVAIGRLPKSIPIGPGCTRWRIGILEAVEADW